MELSQFKVDVVVEPGGMATEFGTVQMDHEIQSLTEGAYQNLASKFKEWVERQYSNSSPPSDITKGVIEAVKAKKPKTRYAIGRGAKSVLLLRQFGSDRIFDKIMMRMINKSA